MKIHYENRIFIEPSGALTVKGAIPNELILSIATNTGQPMFTKENETFIRTKEFEMVQQVKGSSTIVARNVEEAEMLRREARDSRVGSGSGGIPLVVAQKIANAASSVHSAGIPGPPSEPPPPIPGLPSQPPPPPQSAPSASSTVGGGAPFHFAQSASSTDIPNQVVVPGRTPGCYHFEKDRLQNTFECATCTNCVMLTQMIVDMGCSKKSIAEMVKRVNDPKQFPKLTRLGQPPDHVGEVPQIGDTRIKHISELGAQFPLEKERSSSSDEAVAKVPDVPPGDFGPQTANVVTNVGLPLASGQHVHSDDKMSDSAVQPPSRKQKGVDTSVVSYEDIVVIRDQDDSLDYYVEDMDQVCPRAFYCGRCNKRMAGVDEVVNCVNAACKSTKIKSALQRFTRFCLRDRHSGHLEYVTDWFLVCIKYGGLLAPLPPRHDPPLVNPPMKWVIPFQREVSEHTETDVSDIEDRERLPKAVRDSEAPVPSVPCVPSVQHSVGTSGGSTTAIERAPKFSRKETTSEQWLNMKDEPVDPARVQLFGVTGDTAAAAIRKTKFGTVIGVGTVDPMGNNPTYVPACCSCQTPITRGLKACPGCYKSLEIPGVGTSSFIFNQFNRVLKPICRAQILQGHTHVRNPASLQGDEGYHFIKRMAKHQERWLKDPKYRFQSAKKGRSYLVLNAYSYPEWVPTCEEIVEDATNPGLHPVPGTDMIANIDKHFPFDVRQWTETSIQEWRKSRDSRPDLPPPFGTKRSGGPSPP